MAKSGYTSVVVTSQDALRFSWTAGEQSVANCTTKLLWKLELVADAMGRIDSSVDKNWSVMVDGNVYKGKNRIAIGNGQTKLLASGETVIRHDSDGNKKFSYSFSQQFDVTFAGKQIGTVTGSGTGVLDYIARRSLVTATGGTLGVSRDLQVTRYDGTFTHTVTYTCGKISGTVRAGSSALSIPWTPPLDLAKQAPNDTKVTYTLTIETFSGKEKVGAYTTGPLTDQIPAAIVPEISAFTAEMVNSSVPEAWGIYVKGHSRVRLRTTANGAYGSTVKSYAISGGLSGADVTTGVLQKVGVNPFTVKVTDSRGRTASAELSVDVVDYSPPMILGASFERCLSDGTPDDDGTGIRAMAVISIASCSGKNSCTAVVQYKLATENLWITAGEYTSGTVRIYAADMTDMAYDVRIAVTDGVGTVYANDLLDVGQVTRIYDPETNTYDYIANIRLRGRPLYPFILGRPQPGTAGLWFDTSGFEAGADPEPEFTLGELTLGAAGGSGAVRIAMEDGTVYPVENAALGGILEPGKYRLTIL